MKKKQAEELNSLISTFTKKLGERFPEWKSACDSDEEWDRHQKHLAHILALTFEVRDDLYRQHPELKPEGYGDID